MFLRCIALTALLLFGVYWFHIRLEPGDQEIYDRLVQESLDLRTRRALEEKPARQSRQNVQKDIWTENETRHFQIQSQDSELILSQKKEKIEAIEKLTNIECHIENDCILTAGEGIYTYPTHQFTARDNCHLVQGGNQIDGTQIQLDLAK